MAVATVERVPPAGLKPLRHKRFALFWAGGAASDMGTWVQLAAIATVVAGDSGSARSTGLVVAATFAPQGLGSPIGGILADRFDRRRVFLTTLGIQTVMTTVLALVVAGGERNANHLAVLMAVQSCAGSMGSGSIQAMLPGLVPRSELTAAVALGLTGWNLGRVLGPLLAASLLPFGAQWAVGANAISFCVLWVAIAAFREPFRPPDRPRQRLDHDVLEGLRALRRTKGAVVAVCGQFLFHLSAIPFMGLIPLTATLVLERNDSMSRERATSVLMSAQGLGAIVGSLAVATLLHRVSRSGLIALGMGTAAVLTPLHMLAPSIWLAMVAIAVLGGSVAIAQSSYGGVVQRDAPEAQRGRILSWYTAITGTSYGIGLYGMGALSDRFGQVRSFAVVCTALAAVLVVAGRSATVRSIIDRGDRHSPTRDLVGVAVPARAATNSPAEPA